ncbi:MAG: ABC transporter substrate-binding protein, partial [Oscillospiraceae bacterium]|nr:ABC transporter substrate-binding protein [Oscillospiraceae bacterium]
MKKIIVWLLSLLLLASTLAACGKTDAPTTTPTPSNETSEFTAPEVIRIGMECEYAPYNWTQFTETEFSVPIG